MMIVCFAVSISSMNGDSIYPAQTTDRHWPDIDAEVAESDHIYSFEPKVTTHLIRIPRAKNYAIYNLLGKSVFIAHSSRVRPSHVKKPAPVDVLKMQYKAAKHRLGFGTIGLP